MNPISHQTIARVRREYNAWVADETLEDYALRFAPRSFRKWSEFRVANTAFGSISFLMLEAIGGFLALHYGFTNACWAILTVGFIVFCTGLPICYYAARHSIDMDLLTRGAGFGYIGSTFTSLIYATFTFTLFALEASIMSMALAQYFDISLAFAHVISALIVIPLVAYGITTINRLQLWTQALWLVLMVAPYLAIYWKSPDLLYGAIHFGGQYGLGNHFDGLLFGSACTVAFSMVAQIGEQVDFLRFLPEKTPQNTKRWWAAVIIAGPGWIFLGVLRQLGGAVLAYLAVLQGVPLIHAHEPAVMYQVAYRQLLGDDAMALGITVAFVVLSQVKINVTNAYAGSLAWSNFFSRLTHSHPGRVVWLVFNVSIALLLMELGVFGALEKILGLFSNIAIAWIGAVVADLVINKPLGLSPAGVEYKRAYLPDINPVGVFSTLGASTLAMAAHLGLLGEELQAFSAFLALAAALVCSPLIAYATQGRYYLTRSRADWEQARPEAHCCICEKNFEAEDKAYCPAYRDTICSLCCTLESRCQDACKPGMRLNDQLQSLANTLLPARLPPGLRLRLMQFGLLYCALALLTSIFVGVIYYQDWLVAGQQNDYAAGILLDNFQKIYAALMVFLGMATWWLVLNNESRHIAQEESARQTLLLQREIEQHRITDSQLQEARDQADRANLAKSRFLSDMSHEIRTPLNSILGYAQILRRDPAIPTHRRNAVDTIQRSGEHLAALIDDILDISRIEARKFELKRTPIHFAAFVEQLVQMFKPQAEDRGLAFRCQIVDPLPPRIRGDEKRVGQILINLLGNALKFTHSGQVLLRIGYSGEIARFQVIDTGEGIAPDQIENIFQPFQRAGNGRGNAVAGAGLGLTISKILAGIMGGELTVESEVGKGSCFTVRLYLPTLGTYDDLGDDDEDIVGYAGVRRKILIVDDQIEHRVLLESVLSPLGFDIEQAENGQDCVEKACDPPPDLILMDIVMSGMNGLDAANRLRAAGCHKPIIVISANAFPGDRQQASLAGCDDFLAKPIHITALLARIKLHLGLRWLYRGDDESDTPPIHEAQLIVPPNEQLNSLRAAVRIGDLRSLDDHLNILVESNRQYQPFARHVQTLARQFRLADLRKVLGV